mgnify:CR=1 FL=1
MKKKTLLATLVMLSILNGNVFAESVKPGNYDDFFENGENQVQISENGNYTFKNGASITNTDINNKDGAQAIISHEGTIGKISEITINVGNNEKRSQFILKGVSSKNILNECVEAEGILLPNNAMLLFTKNNNIINAYDYSQTTINTKNTDIWLTGTFINGIASDDKYYATGMEYTKNINFNVKGNNSTNFNIYGNMFTGINAGDCGKYSFNNLNDFNIVNTYKPQKVNSNQVGIWLRSDTQVKIGADNLYIGGANGSDETVFGSAFRVANGSKLNVSVNDKFTLTSSKIGIQNAASYAYINADTVNIYATGDDAYTSYGAVLQGGGYLNLRATNNINLSGSGVGLRFNNERPTFSTNGSIEYDKNVLGEAEVTSEEGSIFIEGREGYGLRSEIRQYQDSVKKAAVTADKDVVIKGKKSGVSYYAASRMLDVTSKNSNIQISSDNIGLSVGGSTNGVDNETYLRGEANFDASNGSIDIYGQKSGIVADNSQVSIRKKLDGKVTMVNGAYFADVNITAKDAVNIVGTDDYGIQAKNTLKNTLSDIELKDSELPKDVNLNLNVTSQGSINVLGGEAGIMATAVKDEFVKDEFDNDVLNTLSKSNTDFGSKVNLTANGDVAVQGGDYGVIAFENSNVDITSKNGNILIGATDTNTEKSSNTAAVYAENGANTQSTVNINAGNGVVSVLSGNKGLWASGKGGTINVDGAVNINANYFADESATRSAGEDVHLAVVAGVKSPEEGQNGKGLVDINLKGDVTSSIYGDIVGARGGEVDIRRESGNGALVVNGDVLAGNGGTVSLDMGKNGVLTGRIDDYMDADKKNGNSFFAPQFSYEIEDSGKVDLILGDGSRWNVDGQSWVTTINAGKNTVIDLTGAVTDRNTSAHALTIGTLNGDANFRMNLDGFDKANSDMLYIKNSNGEYNVILDDAVTSEEIGETGLRFATIDNADVNFKNVVVYNAGAFDVKYKVGKDDYENHNENDIYNGGKEFDEIKPGSDAVKGFFEDKEEGIETFANEESKITNYKIIDVHSRELNNTGKTIVGMSRANYSNAIYMDRLNKRLGEARYINGEEDQGMWVRIRHDRIGKDNAFRSQNTMYELGYDEKQECDNGERRVGFAVDYMHGDTSYSNISGKGEIDRYGLWLYDTWMGDKGHYADYVAKWGHLKNDFGIYAAGVKDKITGDYSNNVFSISAEYGRKKDIGNDWYIEPQAQLQLARVTGADYVTNQNTKVSVDGINSLIGRAGFRIGKDFGEEKQSTVYLKADVMHEFLGDQDISLKDKTSDGNWSTISYENEGTWYDVGFGFATKMSKNSYAFMDFEKSFGHDNDETYQINVGMQWSF